MKCIVKDCENHTHQGKFVGELCSPCHEFITEGKGKHSQVFRNTVVVEREECVKDVSNALYGQVGCGKAIEAIRARGQV